MRWLLDTNIISNLTNLVPSRPLIAWMADQVDNDLFVASLTLAEIYRNILEKLAGRKRNELDAWFSGPQGPRTLFAGRILPFDETAALIWSRLMAQGRARGRLRSGLDMIIAAVAQANNCVVVTDNERDFEDIEIINPLRGAP
jgi:predicted nucleic acid-binding protein